MIGDEETIIAQTRAWIVAVVIGCNFCPFASREVQRDSVHYKVVASADTKKALEALAMTSSIMDSDGTAETSFIILPGAFPIFRSYLQLVETAEALLTSLGYDGVYQLASFHPLYLFAGSTERDPANYTNRSPYPMLQILREASVTKAIDSYAHTEAIPERNILYAQEKGLAYMKDLKDSCMKKKD
jgi:hypothetical protein